MEEDANSLADSGGERAERVEMEATFSPDEEEDDHAAKDIEEGMGRTSIAMAMPMSETPQVEGIAATPAPKEMRPTPRRIHFAEEVEATSTTPATTRAEVHCLVLAPDPWFGPPPETPLTPYPPFERRGGGVRGSGGVLGGGWDDHAARRKAPYCLAPCSKATKEWCSVIASGLFE